MNYQTVVGWQTKKVLRLCEENPSELILTLKKRPRHSPLAFGQIYMKPFRYNKMIPILLNIFNLKKNNSGSLPGSTRTPPTTSTTSPARGRSY